VAPTLATAMGGPLGGMALKMVADKLGLPDATMDAVEAAVTNASPSQLADIKKVEADFKVSMKRWTWTWSRSLRLTAIAHAAVTPVSKI
jgi:hypothetical protein